VIYIKKKPTFLSVLVLSFLFLIVSPQIINDNFSSSKTQNNIPSENMGISSVNGGGYNITTNAPYSWIDITETGINLTYLSEADKGYQTINFTENWNFTYYGTEYDKIYVNTDGIMSFTHESIEYLEIEDIPSYNKLNEDIVALFHEDINCDDLNGGGGDVYYNFSGVDPNRYLVIEYHNVSHKNGESLGTFEVIFYQNGTIIFQYQKLNFFQFYLIGLDHGDYINYNKFDEFLVENLPITDYAITFDFENLIPLNYTLEPETEHEFSWLVTEINNEMMDLILGNDWESSFGLIEDPYKSSKMKINITYILDNSTHWEINYTIWDWTYRDDIFTSLPSLNESILHRKEPLNYTQPHNLTNIFPLFIPKPIIYYINRVTLSELYSERRETGNGDFIEIGFEKLRSINVHNITYKATAHYNKHGILEWIEVHYFNGTTFEDKLIFKMYSFYEGEKPSYISAKVNEFFEYGYYINEDNAPPGYFGNPDSVPTRQRITIDFMGGEDPFLNYSFVIVNITQQNKSKEWNKPFQEVFYVYKNYDVINTIRGGGFYIIAENINWTHVALNFRETILHQNSSFNWLNNGFQYSYYSMGANWQDEYIYTNMGVLKTYSKYYNGKMILTLRLDEFDYIIEEDDDDDEAEVNNLLPFIFLTALVALAVAVAATSIYYYNQRSKRAKLARDLTEKKGIFMVKSAKDILEDLSNKSLLLQIFDDLYPKYERFNLEQIKLTMVSEEFLNKVDQLGFDEKNKAEFLKEMLALSQKERDEIVNNIFKRLNSDRI